MSAIARQLLESFDSLPNADQEVVAAEIIRWYQAYVSSRHLISLTPLTDDEFTFAADNIFLELDREEAHHAQP